MKVRCYDNGGAGVEEGSNDRFTIVFTGRYWHRTGGVFWYLGCSGAPFWPQGIGYQGESDRQIDTHNGWAPAIGRKCHLGTRVPFETLPPDVKTFVQQTYTDLWSAA